MVGGPVMFACCVKFLIIGGTFLGLFVGILALSNGAYVQAVFVGILMLILIGKLISVLKEETGYKQGVSC